MGQKRKEKRLSALEELTCTYSIEEMKMPKIMDSNQPHQLRASNLCSLSVVSNNNLKEINHNQQHRTVAVGIGGTILTTNNSNSSSNNTTSNNNNNNNSSSTVYSVPLVSMCTAAPESEVDVTWTTDQYRQQQDQMITENASNRSKVGVVSLDSNSNQNQIISKQHVNPNGQSKHTESSVPNGSNAIMSSTESVNTDTVCLRANESENIMPDITRPSPTPPTSVVTQVDLSSLSNSGCGAGGTDNKSKHLTVNAANQPHNVTEYINIKGAQSTETAVVNNHLSVLLSASSCPKIKVSVNYFDERNKLILICDDPHRK